jgi:hypothetical protein
MMRALWVGRRWSEDGDEDGGDGMHVLIIYLPCDAVGQLDVACEGRSKKLTRFISMPIPELIVPRAELITTRLFLAG